MVGPIPRAPESLQGSAPIWDRHLREGRHSRGSGLAYAALGAVFVVVMLGATLPTPLYVLYKGRFGFSAPTVTLVFAMYAVGVLATLITIGRISDELGRRPVLLAGLGLAAVSTVVFVAAQDTAMLYVGRFLSGVGVGLITGTATAALAELEPSGSPSRAATVATAVNLGGLGLGPVVAGLFAEYLTAPLRLVYACYLAALVGATLLVLMLPETVKPVRVVRTSLKPNITVPEGMRQVFIGASLGAFAAFTLMGLFTSLIPSFIGQSLHETNRAVAGSVVGLLFVSAALVQVALGATSTRRMAIGGLLLLLPALATIELGLAFARLGVLLAGTVLGGIAAGATFKGALTMVNAHAPPDRRAAVVAAFFVVAYTGLTLPVIGVGIATEHVTTLAATGVCAAALAVVVGVSLVAVGLATRPARGERQGRRDRRALS